MSHSMRIGLVGPDQTRPCGIADYTARLGAALAARCDLVFVPLREALDAGTPGAKALDSCRAILVQYERSLVPDARFLPALGRRHPGRIFVVPHEVYDEDPFAFPYRAIRSAFPPLLWLKHLRHQWKHRGYAAEKSLQRRGYGAHRVLPLSGPGAAILRALAGKKILDPVPLAYFIPPEPDASAIPLKAGFFFAAPRFVIGIFGFLNPGLDYALVLDALARLDPGACLLVLGGARAGAGGKPELESAAAARGLGGRVRVTGYLPEASLSAHFALCDLFLCPLRFKSNSSSILNLIHLGKPILTGDLPLTRYLKEEGAPLELFAGAEELARKVEAAAAGELRAQPNRYPWTFAAAAEAYLRAMETGLSS